MITEIDITATTSRLASLRNGRCELRDEGARGADRLVMIVRRSNGRTSTEWYAQRYVEGRRSMSKIGSWPDVSLDEARWSVSGRQDQGVGPHKERRRPEPASGEGLTVRALFEAYVLDLERAGKQSARSARWQLLRRKGAVHINPGRGSRIIQNSGAAEAIGENMLARDVKSHHIVAYLRTIHERGREVHAHHMRAVVHAAFGFGLRSVNRYHGAAGQDWGLEFNPVTAIETNPKAGSAGNRALSPEEFRLFWRWLEGQTPKFPSAAALQLMMVTGQRPGEILQLTIKHYNAVESFFQWSTTKNGHPHCIPLPRQAAVIMGRLQANPYGFYFSCKTDPHRRVGTDAAWRLIVKFVEESGVEKFSPRDLRRTWKTLTGAAGLSKDLRDRLQNHIHGDISSKHYDRWDYMPEKRAAMTAWEFYLNKILVDDAKLGSRHHIVDQEAPHSV